MATGVGGKGVAEATAVGLLDVKLGGRGSGGRFEAEGSNDSVEMPSCGFCMVGLCKDGCTD